MNKLPDLILLHGALGSQSQFAPLKQALQDYFTIYTYDLEGHGGKPIPESYSIASFEKELIQFMNQHGLNNIPIFGYSMGGYIALSAAKNNPGRISKIMTLGTMLKWSPEIAAHETKMLDPEIIEAKIPKFAQQLQERHAPQDWKVVMKRIVEMMIEMGDGDAMTNSEIGEIDIPVLVGLGTNDQMVKLEHTLEMVDIIPGAEFRSFEGWKHPVESVDVKELAVAIQEFLYN
ncbi:MAG TPA: alpha/beta fold hydrolase [Saprospiraceae bacterium]|nr:alpha/beta fold hydrolase [Saprospiraceae bacterium]